MLFLLRLKVFLVVALPVSGLTAVKALGISLGSNLCLTLLLYAHLRLGTRCLLFVLLLLTFLGGRRETDNHDCFGALFLDSYLSFLEHVDQLRDSCGYLVHLIV